MIQDLFSAFPKSTFKLCHKKPISFVRNKMISAIIDYGYNEGYVRI